MAISFQRPDPASPASISAAQFPTSRRGFDQAEVRDFLRMVAAEQARLQERERFLERELKAAQQSGSAGLDHIDDETVTRLLGEEAARVLQTAREAAAQIKQRAEEAAARLLRDATDEGQRLREEAEIEAARRRHDAAADSEAELSMAKQQGRDMVNEARAYRERVLSELARRRELARQQIEQLIHGRDRLLQAFERSRLAAVEVMAELAPLGEPNEYVNLTPTTGPVPMMVPSAGSATGADAPGSLADGAAATTDPAADFTMGAPGTELRIVRNEDDEGDDAGASDDGHGSSTIDTAAGAQVEATSTSAAEAHAAVASPATPADAATTTSGADAATASDPDSTVDPASSVPNPSGSHAASAPDADSTAASPSGSSSADEPSAGRSVEDEGHGEGAEVVELFGSHADESDESDEVDADAPVDVPAKATTKAAGATVEDLFARLRASRASDVAKAVDVEAPTDGSSALTIDGDGDGDGAAGADATAASAAEPEPVPIEVVPVDAVIVPLIVSAARKLKRVLADEQNELLDTLRRKEPIRSLDVLLPWESDQSARYAAAVEEDLLASSSAGAQGNANGRNPAIVRPALDAITNEIVAPLRDRLIRCIDKADGNNTELANQVRALYREWKNQRIDDQVEAIVRLAYDRGALTVSSR